MDLSRSLRLRPSIHAQSFPGGTSAFASRTGSGGPRPALKRAAEGAPQAVGGAIPKRTLPTEEETAEMTPAEGSRQRIEPPTPRDETEDMENKRGFETEDSPESSETEEEGEEHDDAQRLPKGPSELPRRPDSITQRPPVTDARLLFAQGVRDIAFTRALGDESEDSDLEEEEGRPKEYFESAPPRTMRDFIASGSEPQPYTGRAVSLAGGGLPRRSLMGGDEPPLVPLDLEDARVSELLNEPETLEKRRKEILGESTYDFLVRLAGQLSYTSIEALFNDGRWPTILPKRWIHMLEPGLYNAITTTVETIQGWSEPRGTWQLPYLIGPNSKKNGVTGLFITAVSTSLQLSRSAAGVAPMTISRTGQVATVRSQSITAINERLRQPGW